MKKGIQKRRKRGSQQTDDRNENQESPSERASKTVGSLMERKNLQGTRSLMERRGGLSGMRGKEELRSPQGKAQALFKIEVYLPEAFLEAILEASNELGACHVGLYDRVASYYEVGGTWRPLEGASPYDGAVGQISRAREMKLEFRCEGKYVRRVLRKIKEIHPYEEPLINVVRLDNGLFE